MLEVRAARNGQGAFATMFCPAGEVVVDWSERPLAPRPAENVHAIQVSKGKWLLPGNPSRPDDYLNHSCEPNCIVVGVRLIALREIQPDDEVTFDYSVTLQDDPWEMPCNCGAANCRKIIKERRRPAMAYIDPKDVEIAALKAELHTTVHLLAALILHHEVRMGQLQVPAVLPSDVQAWKDSR